MTDVVLNEIIDMLWFHPEYDEWKPKIETIPGEILTESGPTADIP